MPDQPDVPFNQPDMGHGASETVLHPIVVLALVLLIPLILWRPRKFVLAYVLFGIFLIPRGQQLLFLGLHWYVRIIVILVAFVRVVKARFTLAGGINTIDKVFVLWVCCRVSASTLSNWNVSPERAAFCVQTICGYFLLRYLIRDEDDIARAAKALAATALILGLLMLGERISGINPFGYLGGAPLVPDFRNGRVRAQATFGHSILAGCFGATLVPLFYWLWRSGRSKLLAGVGCIGSTLMVLMSNSSTPVLTYAAGTGALFLWPVRKHMRQVRWGIVITIAALALVMKAPVWFIIARINVIGGSGGWDRAFLIDTAIRHFNDWWLIGTNQAGTWGWDMWDMSDQFVAEAESGGVITLGCFITMIALSFSRLGRVRKRTGQRAQWLYWCLGSVMLAHMCAYLGVAYWDQTQVWWFAFLAMVSAATRSLEEPAVSRPSGAKRDHNATDELSGGVCA